MGTDVAVDLIPLRRPFFLFLRRPSSPSSHPRNRHHRRYSHLIDHLLFHLRLSLSVTYFHPLPPSVLSSRSFKNVIPL